MIFKCHVTTAHFTWLDWTFLSASMLSGVYLWITDESLVTLHINMVIDGTGAVFVAINAWQHHGAESFWAWLFYALAGVANLFAIENWIYSRYIYPVTVAVMCTVILAFAIFR
jgi:hypothetical protein